MHVHFLDPYRPRDSAIHRLDPRIKLVLTVAFILTNTLLPTGAWPIYILLFALIISVEVISELGVSYVLKRSSLALPFVLAAMPLIFTIPGKPLFSLSIGAWEIHATLQGVERFVSISIQILAVRSGSHCTGSQHHLPRPAGSHACATRPAAAGIRLWSDVALHVCAGG